MANQIPLVFNNTVNQIQELPALDNLDLTGCGISGATNIAASGTITAGDFNTTSDEKLKDDVKIIEGSLDKVIQINGVSFKWKDNGEECLGVIAQNIEEVFPQLVKEGEDKDGTLSVNYQGLIPVLINAIKEQQEELKFIIKSLNEDK